MANKQLVIQSELDTEYKNLALIVCIAREIEQGQTKLLKKYGLSSTQLNILDILDNSRETMLTVNQIKEQMIDDSPNVSRSLNKLMENNLIIKNRSSKDQRVVRIQITEKGQQLHRDADKMMLSSRTSSPLTEEEQELLYSLLQKL